MIESGEWYCVEYNFDEETIRSVYGPAKKFGTLFQFPQCEFARWHKTGAQMNGMFPSMIIQKATKQEIKSLKWFDRRVGANKPIYNRSSP